MTDRVMPPAGDIAIVTESAEATRTVGELVAGWLQNGDVLLLHGDLGAGKTTFTQGLATGLNVLGVVSSPTFALVNEYETGLFAPASRLRHLDLYRLTETSELATIGYDELISPAEGVTVVEWPERAGEMLPDRYLLVELDFQGPGQRRIRFAGMPDSACWASRLSELRERLQPLASEARDR